MKKETIDLIKSMTEQGFLVIVDPEKLKGDGAVMIEVINLNDVASDEKINDEIAKLAGFKKEEPKPEIDLLQCDGRRFRAKIVGLECEGAITIEDDKVYLCQNVKQGNDCNNKKGFECCWCVDNGSSRSLSFNDVTHFELLPEPKVIFTNCVGEVFTEEDVEKDIKVWHFQSNTNKIYSTMLSDIQSPEYYTAIKTSTDIFRSKKSLLKYIYETCE